jgi:hypothetical protein
VSFAAITLCVASQWVFIVVSVYFVIDSVQRLLDTPSYVRGYVGSITKSPNNQPTNQPACLPPFLPPSLLAYICTYLPSYPPTNIIGQNNTLNTVSLFPEDSINGWWERTEAAIDGLGSCYEIKWVSLYCPILWCPLQRGMLMHSTCLTCILYSIRKVDINTHINICISSSCSQITFESYP